MNYIINPMWFYLAYIIDAINTISIVGIIVSLVILIIGIIIYAANFEYGDDDKDKKMGITMMKKNGSIFDCLCYFANLCSD